MNNHQKSIAVYVISLAEQREKRAKFLQSFENIMYYPLLVDAVNGKLLNSIIYFEKIKKYYEAKKRLITPSELGCTLSHIMALNEFLLTENEWAIIMEDDVIGSGNDILNMANLAKKIKGNSILICGGQDGLSTKKFITGRNQSNGLVKIDQSSVKHIWRTCSYIVTRQSAISILACHEYMISLADDWRLFAKREGIEFYYAEIIKHPTNLDESSIQGERVQAQYSWCSFGYIEKKIKLAFLYFYWNFEKLFKVMIGSKII